MKYPPGPFLVDAHCDIGCHCQEQNRDLLNSTGCAVSVMVTLPLWQAAGVRLVCCTLYTPHDKPESVRRRLLYAQYNMYLGWLEQFPEELKLIRTQRDLEQLASAGRVEVDGRGGYPVGIIFLMEGMELLDSPAEAQTWFGRGLRMASLTWNGVSRYASGTFADRGGLKPPGRELLAELVRLGIIVDLSHLTDRGISDVFSLHGGAVCSTHSNARALCNIERNLTDDQAEEIARRGGVIGLNLLAPLVLHGWRGGDPQPPLAVATQHSAHFAQLLGHGHAGIGSDLDGGLTPENTPAGIDTVVDLAKLGEELAGRGWDSGQVAAFNGLNWWRFFAAHLPR
jgi:membrane dipeptidase